MSSETLKELEEYMSHPRANQTIELDCWPGSPRPDAYIAGVLEGTGLKVKEPVSKFFGNWTWDFRDVSEEEWKKVQAITKPRIEALFKAGRIRYGSW